MKGLAVLLALLACPVLAAQNVNFIPETNAYYAGTVDGKYALNMVLSKVGEVCMGSYHYLRHKQPIFLYGECTDSTFNLQEQQRQSGYTAGVGFKMPGQHNTVKGKFIQNGMSGSWHAYGNEKSYSFSATEIAPKKRNILADAVGTYTIYLASGFCCAHSFAEYDRHDGSWSGMPSDIPPLDKRDKNLLSSFTLVLDKSLEIKMFSAQHLIASLPFTSDSVFSVKNITQQEDEQNNTGRIFKYKEVDTLVGNVVHIATTDNFNLLPYVVAPLQAQPGRYAFSVDYDPAAMGFRISIISEDCCGMATLYLGKHQE